MALWGVAVATSHVYTLLVCWMMQVLPLTRALVPQSLLEQMMPVWNLLVSNEAQEDLGPVLGPKAKQTS